MVNVSSSRKISRYLGHSVNNEVKLIRNVCNAPDPVLPAGQCDWPRAKDALVGTSAAGEYLDHRIKGVAQKVVLDVEVFVIHTRNKRDRVKILRTDVRPVNVVDDFPVLLGTRARECLQAAHCL